MKRKRITVITEADIKRLIYVKEFIEAHPAQRHTIKDLSLIAEINRNKLTYGFKKITGKSIHQYIIQVRMENAKRMLLTTDKPVKAVAQLNGYSNTENFTNAFKKFYGYTPTILKGKQNKN